MLHTEIKMSWFTALIFDFSLIVSVSAILIVIYFKYSYNYWKKSGVTYPKPVFPYGNLQEFIQRKKNFGVALRELYADFKKAGAKYIGIYVFADPVFVPIDTKTIKHILARDFQYFADRGAYNNEKHDPLSGNMFLSTGTKWKHLRTKLSPTFTTGKMKMMLPTLVTVSERLSDVITEKTKKAEPFDIRDTMAKFTTDIIGTCVFGLDTNCLQNPDDELRKCGKRFFEVITTLDLVRSVCILSFPKFMKFFRIKLAPDEVDSFFSNVVKDVIEYREKNKIERKDFLQLVIQLKNQGRLNNDDEVESPNREHNGPNLTLDEATAQCFGFFVGGFETTSSTSSFLFYELCKHPGVQEKCREEILRILKAHNGEITYKGLLEMTYLEQVISETLRKYPIVPVLNRECNTDYNIPGSTHVIKKGIKVFIPVMGLHYDPEYFPDPEKFDPERFSEENKASIDPYSYLPFGEGPRFCIGKRFGMMQTKLGAVTILKKFRLKLNPKTIEPMVVDPVAVVTLSPQHPVYIDAVKI